MTQFTPYPPQTPVGQPPMSPYSPQPRRLSALAVLSLVFGLLFCIPLVAPVLGLAFGVIALVLIAGSQGRVRGQGLAIAGVVISVLVLCVHVIGGLALYRFANIPAELVDSFLYDVANDDQLAVLQRRLADNHGSLESVSTDFSGQAFTRGISPPTGGWNQYQAWQTDWTKGATPDVAPAGPIPIKLQFSRETVYGVMMMAVEPNSPTVPPLFVHSFTLIGDEGPWTFPFEGVSEAAPPNTE